MATAVRSWLPSTCSSTSVAAAAPSAQPLLSDSQTHPSSPPSSIQTSTSLLTLPSLPSLQKFTLSPATSYSSVTAVTINLNRRAGVVTSLAVHNNLLYAALGNEIRAYEVSTKSLIDAFNVAMISTGSVKSITFAGGKVFTAHQDCRIRVWKLNDRNKHRLVATLPTVGDRLRRFVLPRNHVRVRRHKTKLSIEHYDAVSGLASGENSILSISWDRSIKLWEPRSLRCTESIAGAHEDAINAVVISHNKDGLIYTGSADRRIKVWKREGRFYGTIATLEKHKSAVNALALNREGSVLFSGSNDRSILVWEREDSADHMAVAGVLRGHAKAVLCLINVQDFLLSGSGDRTVRIWQRGVDAWFLCLTVLDGHQTPVRSLAAEEDAGAGLTVFSGSLDGEIKMWRLVQ